MKKAILSIGNRGADVAPLQKVLHYLINAPLKVDGIFGANTDYWVKIFQHRNKLKVDGIVGQKTYLALERNLEAAKRFIVTIDAGHGGVIGGKYTTMENGKGKYYIHGGENFGHLPSNPAMFCEGVYNRQIAKLLERALFYHIDKHYGGVDDELTYIGTYWGRGDKDDKVYISKDSPLNDRPLEDRVAHANKIFSSTGCSGLNISLHSNAGKARGIIVFTNIGTSFSDYCSMEVLQAFQRDEVFANMQWKHKKYGVLPYIWTKDNKDYATQKSDHEKRFYVLRNLEGKPYSNRVGSILIENDFFDNREGAKFISNPANQKRYVECLVEGIKRIKEESIKRIPKL